VRIAHLSDIHFCREHGDEVFASLKRLEDYIKEDPVDLIAIAGDIFDAAVLNSGNAGLPEFLEAVRRLGGLAPVAMVYGKPSHDVDSCLEVFEKIGTLHGITILEPGKEYFLAAGRIRTLKQLAEARIENNRSCVLFGIPEPRKKYLFAENSAGKSGTEAAVRDAMRRLCAGLAAKRREYPLPCVVLYHGEAAGCALQNDRTVERGTGIAITVDDLRDIGADYYALVHIHKPQQVAGMAAYYAGSIYPKDFGETHKAGFNVVTLQDGKSYVERFDFSHPQNLKIEYRLEGAALPTEGVTVFNEEQVKGKRVWLEITCEKSGVSYVNADTWLGTMLACGAVPGSRVTIRDIPIETVRAAEITAVSTPVKKFEVWAENSNIKTTPALLDKIKALETEAEACGAKPKGEWELVSVKLRGAIGIKKGIGRDEIAISFDDYDNGLIALTGANGKGKTTPSKTVSPTRNC